jgi:hypothetical protein
LCNPQAAQPLAAIVCSGAVVHVLENAVGVQIIIVDAIEKATPTDVVAVFA